MRLRCCEMLLATQNGRAGAALRSRLMLIGAAMQLGRWRLMNDARKKEGEFCDVEGEESGEGAVGERCRHDGAAVLATRRGRELRQQRQHR